MLLGLRLRAKVTARLCGPISWSGAFREVYSMRHPVVQMLGATTTLPGRLVDGFGERCHEGYLIHVVDALE